MSQLPRTGEEKGPHSIHVDKRVRTEGGKPGINTLRERDDVSGENQK